MSLNINFFEEYPERGELEKAKIIDFPSTIFIAAESVKEYKKYRAKLQEINSDIEPAYWALLDKSYWVSPFADTGELKKLFQKTLSFRDKIFLDFEIPVLKPHLFIKNALSFGRNKRLIRNFIKKSESEIITGEYAPAPILEKLFRALGVSYKSKELGHKRYLMYYTSMYLGFVNRLVGNYVEKTVENDENVAVGLGTIDRGALKVEPILSPDELRKDLMRMKKVDVEDVAIFRLGGLDEDYIEVLRKFAN